MFNYPMPAAELISRLRRTLFIEPTPERKKISGILFALMLFLLAIQIPVKASHIMSLLSGTSINDSIPILTLSQTAISCTTSSNGSITATVSGGSAPFQYSKDQGATWQAGSLFERLGPGRYTIIVKDNGGRQASANITLTAPPQLAATAKPHPVTCYDAGNGSISITASGGTPPYQYFLDNGPTWQYEARYNEVNTGSHTVYVKDRRDCMIKVVADITEPSQLTISAKHDNVTCDHGKDGRITVFASGGTPPYQYSEDNGKTWQHAPTFTHLSQGVHLVQVRDTSGCIASTNVEITAPLALAVSTLNADIPCNGACNGRIVVQAQGGTSPYKYSNNQGLTWQQTPDFPGISAGVYNLVVKDSNGCTIRKNVKLSEPEALSIASASATFVNTADCNVKMAVSGGVPAYAFSIDQGRTWQDSATFAHIRTGSYSIYVKDRNGCGRNVTVTLAVAQPLQLVVDSWAASCYGTASGTLIAKAAGGIPPYRYSVDSGVSWQAQNTFRVRAGAYTVLVEDKAGKRVSVRTQLGEPPLLTATAQPTDVSCHNASNGVIIAVADGGTPPYKYSINNGANWQSKASFEGLPGGSYTLMVRDIAGCGASLQVTVNEPSPLSTRTESHSASCHDASDGSFNVITTGGTPPYQYCLDNAHHWQDTTLFSRLAAGNHYLLVRDARGCIDSAIVQIKAPQPVTFTAGSRQVSCYGGADGYLAITAEGGTMPYRYSMDHVHWQDTALFNSLSAGHFTLYVQDAHGCERKAETAVTEPTKLALELERWANGCSYEGGQIQVNASGGTLPYLYTTADSITNTDGSFKDLPTGSFAVSVVDKNGCIDKLDPVSISVSPQLNLNVTAKTDMQCDGIHKGSVTLTADGGISPYKYALNGQEVLSLNVPRLDNGAYEAVVKDQNGCIATKRFDIILLNDQCELTMPSGFSPNGDGRNDVFRPALYGNIRQYQLQVFNAWGNLIFASNDPEAGWDGALNSTRQPAGTYVWMARYLDYKGIMKVKRGVVTLIR